MAAFHLHQTTENLYRTFLLVLTGYTPKSHDLIELEDMAANRDRRIKNIFPREDRENRRQFEFLCNAYISSRYGESFQADPADLLWLHARILYFKELSYGLIFL